MRRVLDRGWPTSMQNFLTNNCRRSTAING
jgi:hypothetical protein